MELALRSSKARAWHGPPPDLSEGMGVSALEEKTVNTFRSCLKCCSIIRRSVDVSSEGKEGHESLRE